MQTLHIVKIGGNVLKSEDLLRNVLRSIATITEPVILVHGGGKHVDEWMNRLGEEVKMIDGRRITDKLSLDLAVMNYAGLLNKNIVSILQAFGKSALGMCGADLNSIKSKKRQHPTIDYGFVGDIVQVNDEAYSWLIEKNVTPVCCAITYDDGGQLLNTNADTIAAEIAISLSRRFQVNLWYCFEKKGVLKNVDDNGSVLSDLNLHLYSKMLENKQIHSGMRPKLDNCFHALKNGVYSIYITDPEGIRNIPQHSGTKIQIK